VKVAVVQMNSGGDKRKNIVRGIFLCQKAIADRAQFILLPEVFNYRGTQEAWQVAEPIPGESTRPFQELAKTKRVHILLGSLYERIKNSGKAFNTSVLVDKYGKIVGHYRKIHLFKANIQDKVIRESQTFKAGRGLATAQVEGFSVGLSVCYDLRFPWIYRAYAQKGVDILCVPSAFTKATGEAHWEVLLRARAVENLCYVLAPDQIGKDGRGVDSFGHSMIIDPWGKVMAKASGGREQIIYAQINKQILWDKRKALPDF